MSIYRSPLEDDEGVFKIESDLGKCPKCGKIGCTCGPDCSCSMESEEAQASITEQKRQKNLIQSFEE